MRLFTALILTLTVIVFTPAYAQEETTNNIKATKPAVAKTDNPHIPALEKAAAELSDLLNEEQIERFTLIKENFGMIRAVRVAREDVENAVVQCGAQNADLKDDINADFIAWDKEIKPRLDQHEKDLAAALSENFDKDHTGKIKTYLGLIDKAANFASGKIDKKPVTTPKACKSLMDSMARSQEQLGGLLDKISWDIETLAAERRKAAAEEAAQRKEEAEALNK